MCTKVKGMYDKVKMMLVVLVLYLQRVCMYISPMYIANEQYLSCSMSFAVLLIPCYNLRVAIARIIMSCRLIATSIKVEQSIGSLDNLTDAKQSTTQDYKTKHKRKAFKLMEEIAAIMTIHPQVVNRAKSE